MREDIDFKGADRESDFRLISILCPSSLKMTPGDEVGLNTEFHTLRSALFTQLKIAQVVTAMLVE